MATSNINAYDYEQYNAVWCKVVSLEDIEKKTKNDQEIIYEYLEYIHMYYTPESWTGVFQLQEDNWQLSQGEHTEVVEAIIKGAIFYRQEDKKEQIERRDKVLTYIGFEGGFEAYKNASPEERKRVRTSIADNWYNPVNEEDLLPPTNFTEHAELQNEFLNTTFSQPARFYFNRTAAQAQTAIQERDRDNVPAVIGINAKKVAMMWFNF